MKKHITMRIDEQILRNIDKRAEAMAKIIGVKNRNATIEELIRKGLDEE